MFFVVIARRLETPRRRIKQLPFRPASRGFFDVENAGKTMKNSMFLLMVLICLNVSRLWKWGDLPGLMCLFPMITIFSTSAYPIWMIWSHGKSATPPGRDDVGTCECTSRPSYRQAWMLGIATKDGEPVCWGGWWYMVICVCTYCQTLGTGSQDSCRITSRNAPLTPGSR